MICHMTKLVLCDQGHCQQHDTWPWWCCMIKDRICPMTHDRDGVWPRTGTRHLTYYHDGVVWPRTQSAAWLCWCYVIKDKVCHMAMLGWRDQGHGLLHDTGDDGIVLYVWCRDGVCAECSRRGGDGCCGDGRENAAGWRGGLRTEHQAPHTTGETHHGKGLPSVILLRVISVTRLNSINLDEADESKYPSSV